MRHFGADALLLGGQTFPFDIVNLLRDWQTMPELSRPHYRALIEELAAQSTQPSGIRALQALVSRNLGFALFREIERAKKRLSDKWLSRLDFAHDAIDIHDVLTRVGFEKMIASDVARAGAGIDHVLTDGGIRPGAVDVVLRTGGSSLVPAFIQLLRERFGASRVRKMDPLASVVGGLAVVAYNDAGWRPSYACRYPSSRCSVIKRVLARSGLPYEVGELHVGHCCYIDNHAFRIKRMPLALTGLPAIRTAAADREAQWRTFLRFYLDRPAKVYVAYEAGARSLPDWLRPFDPEELALEVVQDGVLIQYGVYGLDVPPGKVMLGGNRGPGFRGPPNANYFVAVKSLAEGREGQVLR